MPVTHESPSLLHARDLSEAKKGAAPEWRCYGSERSYQNLVSCRYNLFRKVLILVLVEGLLGWMYLIWRNGQGKTIKEIAEFCKNACLITSYVHFLQLQCTTFLQIQTYSNQTYWTKFKPTRNQGLITNNPSGNFGPFLWAR